MFFKFCPDFLGIKNVPANQEDYREVTGRPAIIIEDLQDEVSVCCLTSQLHQAANYKYTFLVKEDPSAGRQMGLGFDSLFFWDYILTIKNSRCQA
ncbi:MAG TPA: hypothetical protein PLN06_03770 [Bacteroidales bacterium]|nr:hypothetical protein [Bacteroidales bacterium]HCI55977.1 hypothetical protein [Bacteroidales bacterium]HOU95724.1 hypothetical protein [Bacteroidales bacterium]HQG52888.1 hypothetical protein [Bacteroidales bacterium]HQJ20207.1 hypothetical protein [Bacteroidales bacterium]